MLIKPDTAEDNKNAETVHPIQPAPNTLQERNF